MLPENILKEIKETSFLVTGGAGFIGSNIVETLVALGAKRINILDDLSTGDIRNIETFSNYGGYNFINGDIRDYQACLTATKNVTVVLHQAALGSVPRSIDNPLATNAVNVDGFLNILNAARENGVRTFVYASSSSVYGDDITMPKVESKTGNLLSPYAVSKHTNEKYAQVFSRVYGINTIGLRYFNVFGPKQNINGPYAAVIPLFIKAMMNNEQPTIFGTGETTRDFTFVSNVVQANLRAAFIGGREAASPVLNIAYGGTVSLNELFRVIASIMEFKLPAKYAPERKGDIKNSFADISLAKSQLGFTPQTSLEEGLKITVNWFKANTACIS